MMTKVHVLAIACATMLGTAAKADGEIRLYNGSNESDLQEKVLIQEATGSTVNIKYRKACGAYGGCTAIEIGRSEAAAVSPSELAALKNAIALVDPNTPRRDATPEKPSICQYFKRIKYIATRGDESISVLEAENCMGQRLSSPHAVTIEHVLNVAATHVGL